MPSLNDILLITKTSPIPKEFYPFESEKPFSHCIMCEMELIENKASYLIEKAVKENDVIFEYAICMDCADTMREQLSKDSMRKIQQYFSQRVNLLERRNQLLQNEEAGHEHWLERCLISGKPRSDMKQYQLYGQFEGDQMLYTFMPYMIGAESIGEISELLSPQTRDELDNFIDEHFGLPPEWQDLVKSPDWLVI